MLKCLSLTNWQNHERRIINFDPLCTTIVGDNGAGKSAIIRAIRWVAFNEWVGKADGFITWGKETSHVRLWTGEHRIERIKGGGSNLYVLDGHRYKFDVVNRRSPPDPVVGALHLGRDNFQ